MNSVHNLLKILIDMNIINKEVSFEEQTIIKKICPKVLLWIKILFIKYLSIPN